MYVRTSLGCLALVGLALVACNSSTERAGENGRSVKALQYVEPCTPADCDAPEYIPMIGCADGSEPAQTCAPGDDNVCTVTLTCLDDGGGSPPSSSGGDPDDVVSYEPCDPSECGPIPAIGCPPDYSLYESCGSENGGACLWTITCLPPPSTTPCEEPDACGPMPAIGVVCDDGSTGDLACMQTPAGCDWQPQCD